MFRSGTSNDLPDVMQVMVLDMMMTHCMMRVQHGHVFVHCLPVIAGFRMTCQAGAVLRVGKGRERQHECGNAE